MQGHKLIKQVNQDGMELENWWCTQVPLLCEKVNCSSTKNPKMIIFSRKTHGMLGTTILGTPGPIAYVLYNYIHLSFTMTIHYKQPNGKLIGTSPQRMVWAPIFNHEPSQVEFFGLHGYTQNQVESPWRSWKTRSIVC